MPDFTLPELATLDWVLLAVLALSVLVGLVRGVVFELMSVAGWVVAYFGAQWCTVNLASRLPVGAPGSGINQAAAFTLAFIVVLLVWAVLARLLRLLIRATPLTVLDRLLGGGFGLLRGALLLLALATVVAFTPAVRSPVWEGSEGARLLAGMLRSIRPLLPSDLRPLLPA